VSGEPVDPAGNSGRTPRRAPCSRGWRAHGTAQPVRDRGLALALPRSTSPCEAVIVNTGGGVAGGDSYKISLTVENGASVEATTTAAEKIYRSDGPPASIAAALTLRSGARLAWLPQETILFDHARLDRSLAIDVAADADLIAVETLVFGRLAMGEARIDASLRDSWRLTRAGRLVFADATRLDHAGATLDRRPAARGPRGLDPPCRRARYRGAAARAAGSARRAARGRRSRRERLRRPHRLPPASASPNRLRETAIAAILALSGRKPPRLWR